MQCYNKRCPMTLHVSKLMPIETNAQCSFHFSTAVYRYERLALFLIASNQTYKGHFKNNHRSTETSTSTVTR